MAVWPRFSSKVSGSARSIAGELAAGLAGTGGAATADEKERATIALKERVRSKAEIDDCIKEGSDFPSLAALVGVLCCKKWGAESVVAYGTMSVSVVVWASAPAVTVTVSV